MSPTTHVDQHVFLTDTWSHTTFEPRLLHMGPHAPNRACRLVPPLPDKPPHHNHLNSLPRPSIYQNATSILPRFLTERVIQIPHPPCWKTMPWRSRDGSRFSNVLTITVHLYLELQFAESLSADSRARRIII